MDVLDFIKKKNTFQLEDSQSKNLQCLRIPMFGGADTMLQTVFDLEHEGLGFF